ncbi:hypothetical protein WICPIJ_009809 [Wickerhamomyces pijperi]|uniref:Uncharacterized protein n=1 Tax=Wickerhamomyces pijperi TaxID=599730 RepID=A0A9P8PJZ2_WICPI|nr:hypothetical protein WICPIJ_009809 [Wickerhamomyces pijperi]
MQGFKDHWPNNLDVKDSKSSKVSGASNSKTPSLSLPLCLPATLSFWNHLAFLRSGSSTSSSSPESDSWSL